MALTDIAVRQAKPTGKSYTLKDFDGLVLYVSPKGTKQWHLRFYWLRKRARISLGAYPAVTLKQARVARDAVRSLIAQGVDPRVHRRETQRAASRAKTGSFRHLFNDWRAFRALSLSTGRQSTLSQIDRHFDKDILPWLGDLPLAEISRQDVLEVLRKIERRNAMTTAQKCRTWLNQMFRYAMVEKAWRRTRLPTWISWRCPNPRSATTRICAWMNCRHFYACCVATVAIPIRCRGFVCCC